MSSVTVCLAESEELKKKMYHLRYQTYTTEIPSFKKDDFKDELEIDEYDEHSIHIVACYDDDVIGTLRLVKDSTYGFVMESAFTLPAFIDRTKAVEHSRGIVRKEYRGQNIYLQMLEFAYRWQRAHKYPICLGAPNAKKLYGILKALGWTEIGEARYYHNIHVIPMTYSLL